MTTIDALKRTPKLGALYMITIKGRVLPNLYKYEGQQAKHCQLHGDYIGQEWLMRKRRNSDIRPWGNLCAFDPEVIEVEEVK